jgi:hypothetical protein
MIAILSLTTLLILGAVSAHDNNTQLSADDSIEAMIDDAHDGDIIELDNKTYSIPADAGGEKHILINKSLTFDGVEDKTVIDSSASSVYFDCVEPKKDSSKNPQIGGWRDGYVIKNTGKVLVFNNITFINFNLVSWHDMTFNGCSFINSSFKSYEKNATFSGCTLTNAGLNLTVLEGWDEYCHGFDIDGCIFNASVIDSETVYTNTYIAIVGGSRFYTLNHFNLTNSEIYDSKINQVRSQMKVKSSKLAGTEWELWSDTIEIEDSELNSHTINLHMCEMTIVNSTVNNTKIPATAAYFGFGSSITLKKVELNNTKISMVPDAIYSRKSNFKSYDSSMINCEINTTDAVVLIKNTTLNNTHLLLFFTDMAVGNSTFYDYRSISDAIETKEYNDGKLCLIKTNYTFIDSYLVNSTGKYLIDGKDIEKNTLHKLTVSKRKSYTYGDKLTIKLVDCKGKPVGAKKIYVVDLGTYDTYEIKTNKNGVTTFKFKRAGKYSLCIYYTSPGFSYREINHETVVKVKVNKAKTTVKAPKVTNRFKKSKYFKVTVKNKATKKAVSKVKVKIKVYTGKKYKTFTVKTSKKGIAKINTKSLKKGKHKVVVSSENKNYIISAKSRITIKK